MRTMSAHRGGGANFHHEILGPELVRRGHDVTVLTTRHPNGKRLNRENGLVVYYLDEAPPDQYSNVYWKASARKFDELHTDEPFDATISESEGAYGLVKYSKYSDSVPLIHIKHNTLSTIREHSEFGLNIRGILRYAYYLQHHVLFFHRVTKRIMDDSDTIICVCYYLAQTLIDDYPSIEGKVTVVPNGINIDTFSEGDSSRLDLPEALSVDPTNVVLYVGRLSREKGVKFLIQSIDHVDTDEFIFLIVGSGGGSYVEEIKALADSSARRDRVFFVEGGTEYENVPHYLDLADVVAIPSLHDTFPFTALEAMASRTPIVGSAVGGIPEMIDDGENGLLVPRKDPVRLGTAIGTLLKDPELRRTLGTNGFRQVKERYSIATMAERTEQVIQEYVEQNGSERA